MAGLQGQADYKHSTLHVASYEAAMVYVNRAFEHAGSIEEFESYRLGLMAAVSHSRPLHAISYCGSDATSPPFATPDEFGRAYAHYYLEKLGYWFGPEHCTCVDGKTSNELYPDCWDCPRRELFLNGKGYHNQPLNYRPMIWEHLE